MSIEDDLFVENVFVEAKVISLLGQVILDDLLDLLHIFRNGETNTPFGLNFMLKLQCISSSILWSISAAHIPGAEYTR